MQQHFGKRRSRAKVAINLEGRMPVPQIVPGRFAENSQQVFKNKWGQSQVPESKDVLGALVEGRVPPIASGPSSLHVCEVPVLAYSVEKLCFHSQ